MSKYTTELRFICENACGYTESQGYDKTEEIIAQSRSKIFDFNYPIFDESYREVLETKIIKHFYLREIGTETVGVFKFLLNRKMNEIMPLYNQYYESALIEFNPLHDMDYKIQHEGSEEGEHADNEDNIYNRTNTLKDTGTNTLVIDGTKEETTHEDTTTEASKSRTTTDKYNDTPQGGLTGVQSDAYLTNVRIIDESVSEDSDTDRDLASTIDNDETQTRTLNETHTTTRQDTHDINKGGTFSNSDEYVNHVFGKFQGASYSRLLLEFRETFLNIDMMVINDLNDLFMGVW